jgi:hypothetical protein
MVNIRHVQLGANAVDYFEYDGSPLPFRPLFSWEMDDAFESSLVGASFSTIQLIMKIKLGALSSSDNIPIATPEDVIKYQHHMNLLDYWIVYHGIKDFQDAQFKEPGEDEFPRGFNLIRDRFRHVHEIASEILRVTKPPEEIVRQLVKSPEGKLIATIHYQLHVPLASEQWMLTPLQHEFLFYSHPNVQAHMAAEEGRKNTAIESGSTIQDVLKKLGVDESVLHKHAGSRHKFESRRLG